MTSQASLSEEELVEKAVYPLRAHAPLTASEARNLAAVAFQAIGLSSILSRLEAAEGERDAALKKCEGAIHAHQTASLDATAAERDLEQVRGERDRLREELSLATAMLAGVRGGLATPTGLVSRSDATKVKEYARRCEQAVREIDALIARAALSTGDRQNDDSHVRTAEATQPAQARQDSEGGAS